MELAFQTWRERISAQSAGCWEEQTMEKINQNKSLNSSGGNEGVRPKDGYVGRAFHASIVT